MMEKFVNVYYILNGKQEVIYNTYLAQGCVWVKSIINAGGEITGIIESDKDN